MDHGKGSDKGRQARSSLFNPSASHPPGFPWHWFEVSWLTELTVHFFHNRSDPILATCIYLGGTQKKSHLLVSLLMSCFQRWDHNCGHCFSAPLYTSPCRGVVIQMTLQCITRWWHNENCDVFSWILCCKIVVNMYKHLTLLGGHANFVMHPFTWISYISILVFFFWVLLCATMDMPKVLKLYLCFGVHYFCIL